MHLFGANWLLNYRTVQPKLHPFQQINLHVDWRQQLKVQFELKVQRYVNGDVCSQVQLLQFFPQDLLHVQLMLCIHCGVFHVLFLLFHVLGDGIIIHNSSSLLLMLSHFLW